MKKKRPRGRHRHNEFYVRTPDGGYTYTGPYYMFNMDTRSLTAYKIVSAASTAVSCTIYILMGMFNTAGSYILYVILPYVLFLLPLAFQAVAVVYLIIQKGKMTIRQLDRSVTQLRGASTVCAILAAFTFVADSLFICLNSSSLQLPSELAFLGGAAALSAISILLSCYQKRHVSVVKEK